MTAHILALIDERNELQGEQKLQRVLFDEGQMPEPSDGQIHILVVVPQPELSQPACLQGYVSNKRVQWFIDDDTGSIPTKRQKTFSFFRMVDFPPLAHTEDKYKTIMERESYVTIFMHLMGDVMKSFAEDSGANITVTGNPGVGKSRFYLYCAFHIIYPHQQIVQDLPDFELVLNFGDLFHKYHADTKEFSQVSPEEVLELRQKRRLVRLIEGKSSQLTGWRGVSILFASPGLEGLSDYTKVDPFKYYLPVWTLEEMESINSVLGGGLKLAGDGLIARYDMFGGIPRSIFNRSQRENEEELSKAIGSFKALDIIDYVQNRRAVRDGHYSHWVLQMVPIERDFRARFYLNFLSKHIAEQVVDKIAEDSLQKVSEFAIAHANDSSGTTSVFRGWIYELLCRKWFKLRKKRKCLCRSLCAGV